MTFHTGCIAAVPTDNKQKYVDHAAAMWPVFQRLGATRMVDTWGVDVPEGKVTDFHGAVQAQAGEAIVFSWITWPDRATADAAWQTMMQDDSATEGVPEMPFDGSRMIFGGFAPVFSAGDEGTLGYVQGFTLAVPEGNKAAYVEMATGAWPLFRDLGAQAMVEGWGEDVPQGQRTDFYRATKAEPGEVAVFSWVVWPDRATCDAAAAAMAADMQGGMPEMPFDGMRMMWGGFAPIFDSRAP